MTVPIVIGHLVAITLMCVGLTVSPWLAWCGIGLELLVGASAGAILAGWLR